MTESGGLAHGGGGSPVGVPRVPRNEAEGLDPAGDQRNRDMSCTSAAHVPILTIMGSETRGRWPDWW
jgi:hypothetical protein